MPGVLKLPISTWCATTKAEVRRETDQEARASDAACGGVSSVADSLLQCAVMSAAAPPLARSTGTIEPSIRTTTLLRRIRQWGRRLVCGLSGHEMLPHFEPDRLCLQCDRCGAQTPGWSIDINPAFRRRTGPVVTRGCRGGPATTTERHHIAPDSQPARAA